MHHTPIRTCLCLAQEYQTPQYLFYPNYFYSVHKVTSTSESHDKQGGDAFLAEGARTALPFVPPSQRLHTGTPQQRGGQKPNHSQQECLLGRLTEASSWVALSSQLRKTLKAECDRYCRNLHMGKCVQTQIPGTRNYWVVLQLLILTCKQDFIAQNWLQALSC